MPPPDPGLRDQERIRGGLRIGGWIAVSVGIVLVGIAFLDFFSGFGSLDPLGTPGSLSGPGNFWMAFIGLPLVAIGSWMLKAGYLGAATRYVAGEVSSPLRDTLGAVGLVDAGVACWSCGAGNDPDAKFCDACGVAMRRACPSCGVDNDPDATFCDGCGAKLADR
jgi:ribosomal protein L40E